MENKDIIALTREVGRQLQKEEAYIAYQMAKQAADDDQELQKLIEDFSNIRNDIDRETSKDEKDMPFYDPQIERDERIYSKIYDVVINNNAYYENADYNNVGQLFINGQAMFYDASLLLADRLRGMNDDFGIIPLPKYDETQKEYRSFVNGASNMICVPASCQDLERASIITEALAEEAYKTVTPVLYETYLKRKVTRDADSAEMIDYIIRNRVFDMGYINMFDGTRTQFFMPGEAGNHPALR